MANWTKDKGEQVKHIRTGLILISIFAISLGATYEITKPVQERYTDVINKVMPSVVTIVVDVHRANPETGVIEHGHIRGSGVFISPNGHILSCAHLFNLPYPIDKITVITHEGFVIPSMLIYKEDNRDLSLSKVTMDSLNYATLTRPDSPKVGQEVIAIGSPLGLAETVTTGVISALHRDEYGYDQIQMSAPINPGNSGGPLFNLNGELVGINVSIVSGGFFLAWSGLGFSVSASEINRFLTTFKGLSKTTHKTEKRVVYRAM